jgi:hypothetical protein
LVNLQQTPKKHPTFTHKAHPRSFSYLTLSFILFMSTIQCVLQISSATPWNLRLITTRSFQSCFARRFFVLAPFLSVQVVLGP